MGDQGDAWTPLGMLVRGVQSLIGVPDRSGWEVPDNSWVGSGCPAEALVSQAPERIGPSAIRRPTTDGSYNCASVRPTVPISR
jgi:hypothetical protein